MNPILHSKKNAARILGISERTLHSLIITNQLAIQRIGRRVLISSDTLAKFVRQEHATMRHFPRRSSNPAARIDRM